MSKKTFALVLLAACGSHAATAGFGSWFKRNIADPATDAYRFTYSSLSSGVEKVVDGFSGAVLYTFEKASNGSSYIMDYSSSTVRSVWQQSSNGLIYVGDEIFDGNKWVVRTMKDGAEWLGGKILDAGKWGLSEFKENTEGTADFIMDVGLDKDEGRFVGTQIFELGQFITSKNQFQSFNFTKAFATLNTSGAGGNLTWKISCYRPQDCSDIIIMDNQAITPNERIESSDAAWKQAVLTLISKTGPDAVQQAVLVFEITGSASTAENCLITIGFSTGMKGMKI